MNVAVIVKEKLALWSTFWLHITELKTMVIGETILYHRVSRVPQVKTFPVVS